MIPGLSQKAHEYYRKFPEDFATDFFNWEGKELFLYPYEVDFIRDDSQFQAWLQSRQTGKTMTLSIKSSSLLLLKDNFFITATGARLRHGVRIIDRTKRLLRSSSYWEDLIKPMTRKGGDTDLRWAKTELSLSNGSGMVAVALSEDGESAVGDSTNLAMVDEVGRIPNAKAIITSILRPTLLKTGGKLILASSSWGKYGKGADWYDMITSGQYRLHQVNCWEALEQQKEFITKQEYKQQMEFLKKEKEDNPTIFAMQYENSFEGGLDNPFNYEDIEKAFVPGEYAPKSPHPNYIYCIDWGKSLLTGDKSVIAIIDVTDPDDIAVIQYHSFQSPYTYVTKKTIELALKTGPTPYAIFPDIGVGENQIEVLTAALGPKNINVEGCMLSAGISEHQREEHGVKRRTISKNTAVEALARYFHEGKIKIYSTDEKIKREFLDYTKEITAAGNVKYTHLVGQHDDHVDTLLIAMGVLRFKKPQTHASRIIKGKYKNKNAFTF